jgi:protease II
MDNIYTTIACSLKLFCIFSCTLLSYQWVCCVLGLHTTAALKTYKTLSSVKIQSFQLFENHIAVYERQNGLPKVTAYRLPATGEPIGQLQGGREIDFVDPAYDVEPEQSQFGSSVVRFHYSSMRTPPSVFDYDMDSGVSVLKKIDTVRYQSHCFK